MRVHAWAKRAINGCRSPYRNAGCAMAMPTKRNEAVLQITGAAMPNCRLIFRSSRVRPHAASHVAKEQRRNGSSVFWTGTTGEDATANDANANRCIGGR